MTDREKAIVMAHTGICMLEGDKFQIFHQYVENILGRPVQTIEMSMESVVDEINEKSGEDFIALCREEQEPCEDCVSRRAVFEILNDAYFLKIDDGAALQESVRQLPSVTAQPKMGQWKRINKEKYVQHAMSYYRCSECGEEIIGEHNYCPNCGTKMENEI